MAGILARCTRLVYSQQLRQLRYCHDLSAHPFGSEQLRTYVYRLCLVSWYSKNSILTFSLYHLSSSTNAVKFNVSPFSTVTVGFSSMLSKACAYVHFGIAVKLPVAFSSQYHSSLDDFTSNDAHCVEMQYASVCRNGVSAARHSGVVGPTLP